MTEGKKGGGRGLDVAGGQMMSWKAAKQKGNLELWDPILSKPEESDSPVPNIMQYHG